MSLDQKERTKKALFIEKIAKEFAEYAKEQVLEGNIDEIDDHFDALEIIFENFIENAKNGEE